ncbi:MAG: hypothetical protein K2J78_07170 [Muribaculaceae bacterium]|nr:hypothetical protein [Muribaculaceae bacterium]
MRFKSIVKWGICMAIPFVMGACSSQDDIYDNDEPYVKSEVRLVEMSPATRALANELEPMFVKYTNDVIKSSLEENAPHLVTSPLSATMLMGLLANGVEENSRREITKYLGTEDIVTLNELCATLLAGLPKADDLVGIDISNSLWVNKHFGLSPNKDYLSVLEKSFQGEAFNYDFAADNSLFIKDVNKWYGKNSGGLISDSNLRLDGMTTLALLLNSVYFKAPWDGEIFPANNTKKGVFKGTVHEEMVDMMNSDTLSGRYYYKDENFDIFSLDFGNGIYAFRVVLPSEGLTLAEASELFTPELLNKVSEEGVSCSLTISMPKFNIANNLSLNSLLRAKGVGSFADGRNMTMFDSRVDGDATMEVRQSTVFAVDEKGAVAASVSSGELSTTESFMPEENGLYSIDVNRPFIFYIFEKSTGAWITSGYVANLE